MLTHILLYIYIYMHVKMQTVNTFLPCQGQMVVQIPVLGFLLALVGLQKDPLACWTCLEDKLVWLTPGDRWCYWDSLLADPSVSLLTTVCPYEQHADAISTFRPTNTPRQAFPYLKGHLTHHHLEANYWGGGRGFSELMYLFLFVAATNYLWDYQCIYLSVRVINIHSGKLDMKMGPENQMETYRSLYAYNCLMSQNTILALNLIRKHRPVEDYFFAEVSQTTTR